MGLVQILGVGCAAFGAVVLLVNTSSVLALVAAFLLVAGAVWYAEHSTESRIPPWNRAVLITGCDSGFGYELAHHLDSMGMTVFAGCLNKDGDGAQNLRTNCSERTHVVQLDVTNDQQVADAVSFIEQNLPRAGLHGLVNNAGVTHLGEIECTPMNQFEKIAQINMLGMVRVTRACLPLLRDTQGRVVNVTSVRGILPLPYAAPYNMSKFAAECFSDILRLEMRKWKVQVSIVEPGRFGAATGALEMARLEKDYNDTWERSSETVREDYGREYIVDGLTKIAEGGRAGSGHNIFPIIDAMTDALLAVRPKYRYLVGGGKGFYDILTVLGRLYPYVPTVLMDRLIMRYAGRYPGTPKALQPKGDKRSKES